MVPLVFKTSLGVVRSPEGSTPSLLRQSSPKTTALFGHARGMVDRSMDIVRIPPGAI